jgi:hypothetical protein
LNINSDSLRASAFISSTFIDLKKERKAVAETLRKCSVDVNALDEIPSTDSAKSVIEQGIKQCDFVIVIVGDRYGSIDKTFTGNEVRSLTYWECKLAEKYNKPLLVYYNSDIPDDSMYHEDPEDPLFRIKSNHFKLFKKFINRGRSPAYFDNLHDLQSKVEQAIIPLYRSQVIKKNELYKQIIDRLESKEKEIVFLQEKISLQEKKDKAPLSIISGLGLMEPNRGHKS